MNILANKMSYEIHARNMLIARAGTISFGGIFLQRGLRGRPHGSVQVSRCLHLVVINLKKRNETI